jgi:hypothetical protein
MIEINLQLLKATTEYDLHLLHSDIVIYFHLRNLVPRGHFQRLRPRGVLTMLRPKEVHLVQRQLSKMEIDFALEP